MKKVSLFIIISISTISFSQDITMAVWDFDAKNITKSEVEILTDRLTTKIAEIGKYTVIERARIQEVLEEQGFQQSGLCGTECVVEVGNMLGVKIVVTGSIGKLGELYTIDARSISVESGKIINQASQDWEGKISGVLTDVIPVIAQKLCGQSVSPIMKRETQLNYRQQKGTLYVQSTPSTAEVWINGNKIEGETPLTIPGLEVGKHTLRLEKNEYELTKTVIVRNNEITKENAILKLSRVNLDVFSSPPGAVVSINDKKQSGVTPLTIKDLEVGNYIVKVRKDGLVDYEQWVTLKKNIKNTLNCELKEYPTLSIKSQPTDAKITINRRGERQRTPVEFDYMEPGETEVGVYKENYEDYLTTINLKGGDQIILDVDLVRKSGVLELKTIDFAGKLLVAEYDLKEKDSGNSISLGNGSQLIVDDIPTGKYILSIQRNNYINQEKNIIIDWGNTTKITTTVLSYEDVQNKINKLKNRQLITVSTSILCSMAGGYLLYSSSKNYDLYRTAESDADNYRKKVEFADTYNPYFFTSSGLLLLTTAYLKIKQNIHKKSLTKVKK